MATADQSEKRIRALLVDIDDVTRAGISAILGEGAVAEVVGQADGKDDVLEKLEYYLPQVVIINAHVYNGIDSVEITKAIRQSAPELPVIVITEDEGDPFAVQAVQAGISAYVLRRNVSKDVLECVIQTTLRTGSTVLNKSLMKTVVASLVENANKSLPYATGEHIKDLTPRELEVLKLMATGSTNQEIGQALAISQETTRKHVSRIIEKLGARNRTHASIISNQASLSGFD